MTAEELITGLRERGYTTHRSSGPGYWVIIPRMDPEDPVCAMLGKLGANMRPWHPEQASRPELRAYEAIITTCDVELEQEEGEDRFLWEARKRLAIWEAACRT